ALGALIIGDDLCLLGSGDGHGVEDPYDGPRRTRSVVVIWDVIRTESHPWKEGDSSTKIT
ncbi:MAG TPA: hypothetical protein VIG03_10060, partial [Steroidobacteraceae bacterium]